MGMYMVYVCKVWREEFIIAIRRKWLNNRESEINYRNHFLSTDRESKWERRESFYFLGYLQKLLDFKEKKRMIINPEKQGTLILDLNFSRVTV